MAEAKPEGSQPVQTNLLRGDNVLVVITGASRGIGRELSLQLAKHFNSCAVTFFILARSKEALEEVKQSIQKETLSAKVNIIVVDLADSNSTSVCCENIAKAIQESQERTVFDLCLIVHNAGTLGDLTKKSSELTDEFQWNSYLQTNLVSTILLNNKIYSELWKNKERKVVIVNITSLLSVKAYPSFTQYSVGKAAREAYFRAFAAENSVCKVLNYSPGPVDTKMHVEVCEKTYDPGVREVFAERRHDANLHRKLLTPEQTVKRMIKLLEEGEFESGSRVDYFDK